MRASCSVTRPITWVISILRSTVARFSSQCCVRSFSKVCHELCGPFLMLDRMGKRQMALLDTNPEDHGRLLGDGSRQTGNVRSSLEVGLVTADHDTDLGECTMSGSSEHQAFHPTTRIVNVMISVAEFGSSGNLYALPSPAQSTGNLQVP